MLQVITCSVCRRHVADFDSVVHVEPGESGDVSYDVCGDCLTQYGGGAETDKRRAENAIASTLPVVSLRTSRAGRPTGRDPDAREHKRRLMAV